MATILDLPEMRARVHRWTVAEYEKLEGEAAFRRCELIRGMIVEKMPETPLHEHLPKTTCDLLQRRVRAGLVVRQESSSRLTDSVPEPDAAVVRGSSGDFRARHPATAELVVEVAVSSVAPDRENASLYAEAGAGEYWIIPGEAAQVEVYRRPENGAYQMKRFYRRGEVIEEIAVTGGAVPLDTFFA